MADKILCRGYNRDNGICNNLIGIKSGNFIDIKNHGRRITVVLNVGQTISIQCERCGKITQIMGEKKSDTLSET